MIAPRTARALIVAALVVATAIAGGPLAAHAGASGLEWRLEQPEPPPPPLGVKGSETPVGLGRIGDIEFSAPNRGLLITAGNGSTVPPGVWDYDGVGWHELSNKCGATDGRIAWVAPATTELASPSTTSEFWTVSDGRPGQAANGEDKTPPLEDDSLCRFAVNSAGKLEILDSYATLGFQASSYQAMNGATCINSSDCWFGGEPLPTPLPGAFQLHWNGSSLEADPNTPVRSIQDMRAFAGRVYESLGTPEQGEGEPSIEEIEHPYLLNEISATGAAFQRLRPEATSSMGEQRPIPEYAPGSFPQALGFLRLSADEDALWAAASPLETPPKGSKAAKVAVLRDSGGEWSEPLGPEAGEVVKASDPPQWAEDQDVVTAIAAEPGNSNAWLALDTQTDFDKPQPTVPASVANVAPDGSVSEEQLPSEREREDGVGSKGAASRLVCPAQNDCWMATTQGWLFHLSETGSRTLPLDTDPAFNGPLITYRPPDEGLPQEQSDALAVNDSGEEEPQPASAVAPLEKNTAESFARVALPLLSDERTRLVHGTTLELSFHLAVKAKVRLLAKRHRSVVASTPMRTLKAGRRSLQLRLNVHRWPTKLELQTHALAPLPTVSTLSSDVETVTTSLAFPSRLSLPNGLGLLASGPAF
jgi:hypothetical protein